jgi:murein DD-endopeptidase MepM/ murein hydrolase activator NlpD
VLTSPFGPRWGSFHPGIDIGASMGTPIKAAKSGVVVNAAANGGYGNFTCINHGGGLSTCYAHQASFATSAGAEVAQGEVIGTVGSTGFSTGPHLHFEVRVNGQAVDPLGYL